MPVVPPLCASNSSATSVSGTNMLVDQVSADLKQAMLNREPLKVSVLRMLQAELKNAAIPKVGETEKTGLTEAEEMTLVRKEVKKREEAAKQYESGGSADRAANEREEAEVLRGYLPAAVEDDSVRAFLKEEAAKLGTLEASHRGTLIRAAMAKFEGQIDGGQAARLVGELF